MWMRSKDRIFNENTGKALCVYRQIKFFKFRFADAIKNLMESFLLVTFPKKNKHFL
jgi:hypothetical protein